MKLKEKGQKTLKIKKKVDAKEAARLSTNDIPRELWLLSSAIRISEAVIRVIFSGLVILAVLFLVSCSSVYDYSEPEDRYIVSAMGFDSENEVLTVSARIVTEDESQVTVFSGSGESVEYAMSHIKGADAKQLELSHLAVIVVGSGVDADELSEIFDHCRSNADITVGVRIASAHSARELLSLEGADGYTLTGALRDGQYGSGFSGGSRFYEVEEHRLSEPQRKICHLPYFSANGSGYFLDGLKIYDANGAIVRLDRTESAYYMMLRNEFDGGVLDFEYGGEDHSTFVISCKTLCGYEDGRVNITCELDLKNGLLPDVNTEEIMKACSDKAESLCRELFSRYGDVMSIEKRVGVSGVSSDSIFVECRVV